LATVFVLISGIVFTGLAIGSAFDAYRLRRYDGTPVFEGLFRWANEKVKQVKGLFLHPILAAVNQNQRAAPRKTAASRRAMWFTLIAFLSFRIAIIGVGSSSMLGRRDDT
jgi:hypothetical protein